MFSNITLAGLDIKFSTRTGLLVGVGGWSLLLVKNVDDISVVIGSVRLSSVIGNSKGVSGHTEIPICDISAVFSE